MEGTREAKLDSSAGITAGTPNREKTFMCGVVEGFYGRPWTNDQRRELFHRMKKFGMNTYMYAPKDDAKHRANWRDLYSVDEVERLSLLISEAKASDVTFVYALSPGLDITFSSSKDMTLLKRKLDQMVLSGCSAFALLFDDIELEMSSADKEVFQSLAHAQVAVTNEVYEYLGHPATFLFCPTEYCASRAVPEVSKSPYLTTVGSRLMADIDVLWTGPRVVSRNITAASLDELNAVLCRRAVIWDNMHANDYDHRRVFLGPYGGRASDTAARLNGVLTNPNCEFEANYVALHTLGTWSRSALRSPSDAPEPRATDADIKLEVGDDSGDSLPYPWSYSLKQALVMAAADWLTEFDKQAAPMVPAARRYAEGPPPLLAKPDAEGAALEQQPAATESADGLDPVVEPMDVALEVAVASSDATVKGGRVLGGELATSESGGSQHQSGDLVSVDDVLLVCDMMHTPFEYGPQSTAMLGEFHWLKSNARFVAGKSVEKSEVGAAEWRLRADKFLDLAKGMAQAVDRLFAIPNRAIVYDLYPYMWEARSVLTLVGTFVKWLGALGTSEELCLPSSTDPQPPITHKGGLTAEFERMLPLCQASDLFPHKPSSMPSWNIVYTVRPYRADDEAAVYEVCRKTCDDGADGSHVFADKPNLIGDKLVGDMLTLSPHLSFVMEDRLGTVCGYALSARDALDHYRKVDVAWTPAVREKYPPPSSSPDDQLTPEEEVILSFHNPSRIVQGTVDVTSELYNRYPSVVRVALLQHVTAEDPAAPKRLAATVLAALKACGSCGAHCEISIGEEDTLDFYTQLGFVNFQRTSSAPLTTASDDMLTCVRAL